MSHELHSSSFYIYKEDYICVRLRLEIECVCNEHWCAGRMLHLPMLCLTNSYKPSRQFNGTREVTHLVNRVAEVVQNVCLGNHSFLAIVQLFQGLLQPQHGMVIVCIVVSRLSHVEAVIHGQYSIGVHTWWEPLSKTKWLNKMYLRHTIFFNVHHLLSY